MQIVFAPKHHNVATIFSSQCVEAGIYFSWSFLS